MVDPNEAARRLRDMVDRGCFGSSEPLILSVLNDRDRLLAAAAADPSRTEARLVALGADVAALAARLDAIEGDWSTRNAVAELNGWRDVVAPMIARLDDMHRMSALLDPGEVSNG